MQLSSHCEHLVVHADIREVPRSVDNEYVWVSRILTR